MKVLITGAAGFIGSNLADALLRRGDRVMGLDNFDPYYDPLRKRRNLAHALSHPRFELVEGDVADTTLLGALLARQRPDGIVHLAARVSNRRSLAPDHSAGYAAVNVGGTAALIAACAGARLRSFVFVSTANVYDSAAPAPFREGFTPELPRTPYSRSKRQAETLVMGAAGEWGLPATVLRLFTTYGPRQRPDMVHSRFASALLCGEVLTLIGDGSDLRDYIHVDDACSALLASLDRPSQGEVINIGAGAGTTLDALLALMARLSGKKPLIRRRAAAAGDTRRLLADISRARERLGWRPAINLEEGVRNFLTWFASAENAPSWEGVSREC